MNLRPLAFLILPSLAILSHLHAADQAPSRFFDLHGWKLQVPGPQEFKSLQDFSSNYFDLSPQHEMSFHLDAAETGATANAHYVRSELRHHLNWPISASHDLAGEVRVISHLTPDKVTVLQIHGINADNSDAPPLLRIAVNNGNLIAALKPDNDGENTEMIPLLPGLGSNYAKIEVSVQNKQLKISVNGITKLTRDLGYWKYLNYFKAGCYPQSNSGTVDVMFRNLTVR